MKFDGLQSLVVDHSYNKEPFFSYVNEIQTIIFTKVTM